MLSNEEKQRIHTLESKIANLESIIYSIFTDSVTGTVHASGNCNGCGIIPYEGFVCGSMDCPIGCNPHDDIIHNRAKEIVNIHQEIIDKTS